MSVYNGEEYLREAIDSILNQTFGDFEFLIIDDGSRDNSLEILKSFKDKRIRIIENKKNLGLIASLNKGLKLAKGKYIARMDADDIALPERFEKQFDFMEKNPEIGVCGTWIKLFGAKSEIWSPVTEHKDIFAGMLFESMAYHPTIFLRNDIVSSLKESYDKDYKHVEDYEYWVRLALRGVKFANLDEVLLFYRVHPNQIGKVHNKEQKENSKRIMGKFLKALGIKDFENNIKFHVFLKNRAKLKKKDIEKVEAWIETLIKANKKEKVFDDEALKKRLALKWFGVCYNSTNNGFWVFRKYKKNPLSKFYYIKPTKKIKFLLKSIFNYE